MQPPPTADIVASHAEDHERLRRISESSSSRIGESSSLRMAGNSPHLTDIANALISPAATEAATTIFTHQLYPPINHVSANRIHRLTHRRQPPPPPPRRPSPSARAATLLLRVRTPVATCRAEIARSRVSTTACTAHAGVCTGVGLQHSRNRNRSPSPMESSLI